MLFEADIEDLSLSGWSWTHSDYVQIVQVDDTENAYLQLESVADRYIEAFPYPVGDWQDFALGYAVWPVTANGESGAGFRVNYGATPCNEYIFGLFASGGGVYNLGAHRMGDNCQEYIGGATNHSLRSGWNTVLIEAFGDLIRVYLNGSQIVDAQDSYSPMLHGNIRFFTDKTGIAAFDDIRVTELLAP